MRSLEIDFSRIRAFDGSKQKGFEQLVCQLAEHSKPEIAKEFVRKDGAGGDAGVECFWKMDDGSEHAWQAKYFLNPLTSAQWNQITKSVESALSKHPALSKYYICLPKDRNDSRRLDGKGRRVITELDKWYAHLKKWREMAAKRSMDVEFEYWGKHEITSILANDIVGTSSIAKFWFDATSSTTVSFTDQYFPTKIIDEKIINETDILRKCLYFREFDRIRFSLTLARKLTEGELSVGSDEVRSKALGWCVRVLSDKQMDKAELYLLQAREIEACPEIDIADAFMSSRKGDKAAAMRRLAAIDLPVSRSASLIVVAHHDCPKEAVDWIIKARVNPSDLDAYGKRFLLACYFELADWVAARTLVDALTDDDLCDSPTLYHMTAVTHLLTAVPDELRAGVLNNPPFDAVNFPLASDCKALEARRTARRYFINGAKVAGKLNCPVAQRAFHEYALWLELRDPDASDSGRKRLESRVGDPVSALHLVRLGVQFGIALDVDSIDREIERQTALNGKITSDAALARFALVFAQQTPNAAARYIGRHRRALSEHIDDNSMRILQIELLSKAGHVEEAKKHIAILVDEGIPEFQKRRLEGIIAEAEGADPLERYEIQFKETGSLSDLQILVHELESRSDWESLCEYSGELFEKTRALQDAERFALALYNTRKNEQLFSFLELNESFLVQSRNLNLLHCWTLYMEGELLKANDQLEKLGDDWDDANYRNLHLNLGISLGDRNVLSAFVANECRKKDNRNAHDLIRTADLAIRLDFISEAKELIAAAVKKQDDDPDILGAAGFFAIRAGWEDEQVFRWIHKSATLSRDDGPLKTMTLREVVASIPEWNQRETEITNRLTRGELPMFLAAISLNKSLSGFMFTPALVNSTESDPRRRIGVPAYSGQRQPMPLNLCGHVGIESTALITLSYLDLLDPALDAFDTVHIPHSTIGWLFDEKQRATFHQPSRIKDAHQVRHLLATGALEELSPSTIPDGELCEQIGEELAQFIAEAENKRTDDELQHIVVQPAPVYRVASLMEEEADLTAYADVLSGCEPIVDKLREKAKITALEADNSRAYFKRQEKPWPKQPQIADKAVLYLDSLAVRHFLNLGILEKLKDAGFKPIISSRVVTETNHLISYARVSDEVEKAIERIRLAINSRIKSGKIKVCRRVTVNQGEERLIYEHPTAAVFYFPKNCDRILSDERVLNQHPAPLYTTLDLIDALVAEGVITGENRLEYRTRLRQAGYLFVPVTEDELVQHLATSPVENGEVIETAELKAIRENILQIRMSTWLQLPMEEPWLRGFLHSCQRALAQMWRANGDFVKARVCSEWILGLIDVRGWAHTVGIEGGDNIVKSKYGESILSLISLEIELLPDVRDEFRSWVKERVLGQLKEQSPDVFRYLVESYKGHISHVVDKCMTEIHTDDDRS